MVHDWSGFGEPLDLTIRDPDAVRWWPDHLVTEKPTMIVSSGPATKILDAIRETGEITVEVRIQPHEIPATGVGDRPNESSPSRAPRMTSTCNSVRGR